MNLSLNNCHGQCYDGASNMSGAKNGVAKQISDCYGHALNLAVRDTVKQSKIMRDALDTNLGDVETCGVFLKMGQLV